MIVTLIVFIIILSLLILVHEFGHFIIAKRSGVKVEEFAFGFPPRIFAIKRGETEYAINLLPFGGYVRMLGEEEDVAKTIKHNPRSFASQSVWTRSKILIAGVIMNLILGWFLVTIGFMIGMPPVVSQPSQIPLAHTSETVGVVGLIADSAAVKMGIKPGDSVLTFNSQTVANQDQLYQLTTGHRGETVVMTLNRKGKTITINGQLGTGKIPLGVSLSDDVKVQLPIWWAPIYSVWEVLKTIGLTFVGVFTLIGEIFTKHQVPAEATGPVGIFYLTRSVLDLGFAALLNFVAVLSVNLAVINVLPIPALDGGRLLFVVLEKFNHGKKVINATIENWAHTIAFFLLIAFVLFISYHDILRFGH